MRRGEGWGCGVAWAPCVHARTLCQAHVLSATLHDVSSGPACPRTVGQAHALCIYILIVLNEHPPYLVGQRRLRGLCLPGPRMYRHFAFKFQPDPPFAVIDISDELPLTYNSSAVVRRGRNGSGRALSRAHACGGGGVARGLAAARSLGCIAWLDGAGRGRGAAGAGRRLPSGMPGWPAAPVGVCQWTGCLPSLTS